MNKPFTLDVSSFEMLLEAAWVIQSQQQREMENPTQDHAGSTKHDSIPIHGQDALVGTGRTEAETTPVGEPKLADVERESAVLGVRAIIRMLGSAIALVEQLVVLLVIAAATVLAPYVWDLSNNTGHERKMTRTSPTAGAVIEYPSETELKNCVQMASYELVFDTNSDQLKGTDWPILRILANLMKKDSTLKIEIAGHTDKTGNATANQTLSERRANTVKKTLTEKYGVEVDRLSAKGYGAEQPLADNGTEQGRAINRRVEIVKQ